MNLYLVADYDINGKHYVTTHKIDGSQNLARITSLTSLQIPTKDGKIIAVAPKFLLMCKSGKKAVEVTKGWESGYRKVGSLYNFKPLDPTAIVIRKTSI